MIYLGVLSSFDVVLAKNSGAVNRGKTKRKREKHFRLQHFDDGVLVKHTETLNGIFHICHCAT